MLLPPQFKDEALKTLGPPIRKEEEKKPVEVYIGNGVWRVDGKLETRIPENEQATRFPLIIGSIPVQPTATYTGVVIHQGNVSEIDIPLPEFNGVWRPIKECPLEVLIKMRSSSVPKGLDVVMSKEWIGLADQFGWEWLDETR